MGGWRTLGIGIAELTPFVFCPCSSSGCIDCDELTGLLSQKVESMTL